MDKRYQVFVSSTYADLREERQKVIQTLMEMDCIPSGMELFPAADEEQWAFIKKIIDDCDYYLLIIGGRYGSTTTEGISYTEKEYDYAIDKGVKVIAFLHEEPDIIPVGKTDKIPELSEKLAQFRARVQENRLVKYWKQAGDLPGLVSLSLSKTIKTYPAVGWIRATGAPSSELLLELNTLRKETEELRSKVQFLGQQSQPMIENIAGMDESITLYGTYKGDFRGQSTQWTCTVTWNQIFAFIAPYLLENPNDGLVQIHLKKSLLGYLKITSTYSSDINDQLFHSIKIQLMAHGLIEVQYTQSTNGSMALFWTLTNKGRALMIQLRTIKKAVC